VNVGYEHVEDALRESLEYFEALQSEPITVVKCWPLVLMLSLCLSVPVLIFGRQFVGGDYDYENATD
jgi:hypothetical protein